MEDNTATDTNQTTEKLTITRENVDAVCRQAIDAGARPTIELVSQQFVHPSSTKLRFLVSEWKESNKDLWTLQDRSYYVQLCECQEALIADLNKQVDLLTLQLQEFKEQYGL